VAALAALAALGGLVAAVPPTTPAWASWSVAGDGAGGGGAYIMPTGTAPAGRSGSTTVAISWAPATLPGGQAVAGYVIHRYNATTGIAATVQGGCSGVVATPSCSETGVPAGRWVYTDTPVQLSWTGTESPDSLPISVG
jgi:hypothetical protein